MRAGGIYYISSITYVIDSSYSYPMVSLGYILSIIMLTTTHACAQFDRMTELDVLYVSIYKVTW